MACKMMGNMSDKSDTWQTIPVHSMICARFCARFTVVLLKLAPFASITYGRDALTRARNDVAEI